MIARHRGHEIRLNGSVWVYADNSTPVATDPNRQCGHCNLPNREDGHDACLGEIAGASNACCGHGSAAEAYVQTPKRIQLRRSKGWRKPEGAVVVSRPGKWGNPEKLTDDNREQAVASFEVALLAGRLRVTVADVRRELAGKDLCCWCPLYNESGDPVPCHADVLLRVANEKCGET